MDFQSEFGSNLQILKYMIGMRPIFDYKALYADPTENFVSPPDPEPYTQVTFRFRTAADNVDRVYLVSGEKRIPMKTSGIVGEFEYHEAQMEIGGEILYYYFEIISGRVRVFFDQRGVKKDDNSLVKFTVVPGIHTPDWSKGAVIYQIYTDRFYNGDPSNDVLNREYYYLGGYSEHVEEWNSPVSTMDVRRFYGGDLAGVLKKLPYLQELGVEVIYFNPLFVSPSNHKYDIQDYDHIDPHLGVIIDDGGDLLNSGSTENKDASRYIRRVTSKKNLEASNKLFAHLVEECHKVGIKVIIDGVFNHCGSFNKWLDREEIYEGQKDYDSGAYVSEYSPYVDFFDFSDETAWPENPTYDGWWGHETLPKLNYENSSRLCEYILRIAAKWVSPPYNADGWRLDVAADLGHSPAFNHQFWKFFRQAVKKANPEAVILAEHYGDPSQWLGHGEWDSIMNYDAFMEPVTWFLTGMQKHSDEYREDLLNNPDAFWSSMIFCSARMPISSLFSAMNELSNHDHSRFLTRTNHLAGRLGAYGPEDAEKGVNKAVMREAVVIQMTWVGCPTIYYGDEVGMCGFTDPDNRRPFPWDDQDVELFDFHRACIRIHKENPELRTGSLMRLAGKTGVIAYARFNRHNVSVIAVNNNNHREDIDLDVWRTGIPAESVLKRVMLSTDQSFTTEPYNIPVHGGKLHLSLPPTSAIIAKASYGDKKLTEKEMHPIWERRRGRRGKMRIKGR